MQSKKFSLNKTDLLKILKVVVWAALSAGIAALIAIFNEIDVPVQYAFLVPTINGILYAIQRYLAGR